MEVVRVVAVEKMWENVCECGCDIHVHVYRWIAWGRLWSPIPFDVQGAPDQDYCLFLSFFIYAG